MLWAAAVGGLLAVPAARAVDLSGVYVDDGRSIVSGGRIPAGERVSLYALLNQEFELPSLKALQDHPIKVEIRQNGASFAVRVFDEDGESILSGRWRSGPDYVPGLERVSLSFPLNAAPEKGNERYVYSFSKAGDGDLLRVEIWHLMATQTSSESDPIGEFLFARY